MCQKILLSCLCIFVLFSCRKDDPKVIVDIDDDFYINMFEDISNNDKKFQINITTIQEQTCINFEIDYDLNFNEQTNSFELIINDLVEPEDCAQGTAFASVVAPFGRLSEGSYSFNLNLKDAVINTGRLFVREDSYELNMNSNDGIEILNEKMYRIPEKTLWGYAIYEDGSADTEAVNFISDLQNLSNTQNVIDNNAYNPGFYGYFNLDDDKRILINPESETTNYQSFIFSHESNDLSGVEELMTQACTDSSSNLKIYIYTDTGMTMVCP